MKDFDKKLKELLKIMDDLEKLMIKIISLAGWILILIKLFS